MAIPMNIPNRSRQQAAKAEEGAERVRAEFYANIGYWDHIGGEDVFVSLPWGLGLETMPEIEVKGSNEKYVELCRRKNKLLRMLVEGAASLEPGESDEVQELVVQVRRDKPKTANTANPTGESTLTKLTFGRRT